VLAGHDRQRLGAIALIRPLQRQPAAPNQAATPRALSCRDGFTSFS